jgi:hypothetical protein
MLIALPVLIAMLMRTFGRFGGIDADAERIAASLASDVDQRRLLTRWLIRAQWGRFVGGLAGFVVWGLGTRIQGDLLLCGAAGIAFGAMSVELHHAQPSWGPRTARLEVRSIGFYALKSDLRRMAAVAFVAMVLVVVGIANAQVRPACWWGLATLAVLGAAGAVQHRVATRPRPALPPGLQQADDLARELAIGRGLARPSTYLALALVARACYSTMPIIGGWGRVAGGIAWLYALYLWWSNRRLGLDFLITHHGSTLLT